MPNLSQIKRQRMLEFLEQLKETHNDDASICAFSEIENHIREKKYGLVYEEHTEEVDELLKENIPVLCADAERRLCKDKELPWNFIIEGDNLQALYLLEKTHKGKVDCIYIDPPYNTGAKDWKYNNDYVDGNDAYRHSKWLSMMECRLKLAKRLLSPDGALICAIDENEASTLKLLLEEVFGSNYESISVTIVHNPRGIQGKNFSYTNEFAYFVFAKNRKVIGGRKISEDKIDWRNLRDNGNESLRSDARNCFYPIIVEGDRVVGFGDVVYDETIHPRQTEEIDGKLYIYPIDIQGIERKWRYARQSVENIRDFLRVKKIRGHYEIELGKRYGTYRTVWTDARYDANEYGKKLLNSLLPQCSFDFPKSLWNIYDCIYSVVAQKKEAVIVDFFAGSGTTLHAVNLLNAEDGGHRRCIMVTNNEVSLADAKKLTEQGFQKGDPEWEALGIAKCVTWPRTVCSIEGHDSAGKPLKGNYGVEIELFEPDDEAQLVSQTTGRPIRRKAYRKVKRQQYPELAKIRKSDGFVCNVKYFKCDWTPRRPEDYLLSNALCLHIKEMIELQSGIEVDNIKNILVLNKEDFRKYIMDNGACAQAEHIWVNQNIVFNSEELERLNAVGCKYIPKEFFGQELKEAAE